MEAEDFCKKESSVAISELYGVTDGKAVGTFIEHKFTRFLARKFDFVVGNSANGIDLPTIDTDIKVTSVRQPQSSSPFRNAGQKIFGLGYNLLLFVYDKRDDEQTKTSTLNFVSCVFIDKERCSDFQTTSTLNFMISNSANAEDIFAYLCDRNIPADEVTLTTMAETILANPPKVGYLTISNALQWRLQYGRIVNLDEPIEGITKIIDRK